MKPCREYRGDGWPVLDVFFVPDDELGRFTELQLGEIPLRAGQLGLPGATLVSICASDTREYYPDVTKPHISAGEVSHEALQKAAKQSDKNGEGN